MTEFTNKDVARLVLEKCASRFDGVTFFSETTQTLLVLLANGVIVPLEQCHVSRERMFTYFDAPRTRGTVRACPDFA